MGIFGKSKKKKNKDLTSRLAQEEQDQRERADSADLNSFAHKDATYTFEINDSGDEIGERETDILKETATTEVSDEIMDKETVKWYKKVMKWTQQNRNAYLLIKGIQLMTSWILIATTFMLYKDWQGKVPDHEMMAGMKLIFAMLVFDILTFLVDFVMVIKRWRFFINMRHILCCIAFTLGIMI